MNSSGGYLTSIPLFYSCYPSWTAPPEAITQTCDEMKHFLVPLLYEYHQEHLASLLFVGVRTFFFSNNFRLATYISAAAVTYNDTYSSSTSIYTIQLAIDWPVKLTKWSMTKNIRRKKDLSSDIPVSIVRVLFHVNFAESRLFIVVRLFLRIRHCLPSRTWKCKKNRCFIEKI